MNDPTRCLQCGGGTGVNHRCPRERECLDCGQPADMFVADPERLVFDEVVMARQADGDPEEDSPLCEACFYVRARAQTTSRSN